MWKDFFVSSMEIYWIFFLSPVIWIYMNFGLWVIFIHYNEHLLGSFNFKNCGKMFPNSGKWSRITSLITSPFWTSLFLEHLLYWILDLLEHSSDFLIFSFLSSCLCLFAVLSVLAPQLHFQPFCFGFPLYCHVFNFEELFFVLWMIIFIAFLAHFQFSP